MPNPSSQPLISSWASPRDLEALEPEQIAAYISKSKSKGSEILTAYKTAQDPTKWEEEQQQKADDFARKNAGLDEIDEDEPEKEEDELDEDGDEAAGDKRKRSKAEQPSSGKKAKADKPKGEKKAKVSPRIDV